MGRKGKARKMAVRPNSEGTAAERIVARNASLKRHQKGTRARWGLPEKLLPPVIAEPPRRQPGADAPDALTED